MITQRKTDNAVGGTTARACESCLLKRARWYCSADEAFLCQSCDASVHSANLLASRHERVRLKTASCKPIDSGIENPEPAWHQGFTRKARTPRHTRSKLVQGKEEKIVSTFPLVPEIGREDGSPLDDDEEEQLLVQVPVFEPFHADLFNIENEVDNIHAFERRKTYLAGHGQDEEACVVDDLHGFFPPGDMNLLESLLGMGIEDEACGMEGLGLLDCKEEEALLGIFYDENMVKVEDDEEAEAIVACNIDQGFDMRETLYWNFDYESPLNGEEEEEQKIVTLAEKTTFTRSSECKEEMKTKITLSLNYEGVIAAWANQDSPWTTGSRPEFSPDVIWPHFLGMGSVGMNRPYGGTGGSDVGREARVMRYREKRRTRLFSKKIRYEVRKLNAEKRPRIKGRFVKRTSFSAGSSSATAAFPNYMMMK